MKRNFCYEHELEDRHLFREGIDLEVKVMYKPEIILSYTKDHIPIFGDRIVIEVLGQEFIQDYTTDYLYQPLNEELTKAVLLGKALTAIGSMVIAQAGFGVKTETKMPNGKVIKTFGKELIK